MSMPAAALVASGVQVSLGGREVLHDVNLVLPEGRWTCIVGPNGAGKSTLLKVMAGLLPHAGTVMLGGHPLAHWTPRERACQLAWLGEDSDGAEDLMVRDVVMLGRLPHQRWLAPASESDQAAVEWALQATGAGDWRDRNLGELSAGERQRVLTARALAVQAPVLLMDEPLAHLDLPHQADWLALVRRLVQNGQTVVSVLHELGLAIQADDLVILDQGRVQHHGAASDAATHAALCSVFANKIKVVSVDGQWTVLHAPHRTHEP